MQYKLSPSILSADFYKLGEDIRQTEENGAEYLHFDVMDGCFCAEYFHLECRCSHRLNHR